MPAIAAPSQRTLARVAAGALFVVVGTAAATAALVSLAGHGLLHASATPPPPARFTIEAPKPPPPQQRRRERAPKKASPSRTAGPAAPSLGTSIALAGGGADLDVGLGSDGFGSDVVDDGDVVMTDDTVDEPPRPISRVAPVHPARARKQGLEGEVTIALIISADGDVVDPRVVASTPTGVFDDAALTAIARWRFSPARYRGQAVRVRRTLTIAFTLQ